MGNCGKMPMGEAEARRTAVGGREAYYCPDGCHAWHHRNRARYRSSTKRKRAWRWGDWTTTSPGWAQAGTSAFEVLRRLR